MINGWECSVLADGRAKYSLVAVSSLGSYCNIVPDMIFNSLVGNLAFLKKNTA